MKQRLAIPAIILSLTLLSCATSPPPTPAVPTPFTATDVPPDANNGLMIMGVRAFEMDSHDKISDERAVLTGIAVKSMDTGQSYNIFLTGDLAMTQLPAGTYCISRFPPYTK